MTWIDHTLGIASLLFCAGIVSTLVLYACVVVGKRADNRIERH